MMKNVKILLALLLAMTMVLCLCACGKDAGTDDNSDDTTTTTTTAKPTTEAIGSTPNDPEPVDYVYSVTVQDTAGNPISGVFVQICAGETCVPKSTDDKGFAGYDKAIEGDGARTAKIISMPEGYTGVQEIVMGDDNDVFFVLTKTAGLVYTVKVQDVDGNAISGVFVQICAGETCVPKSTDVNGIACYDKSVEGNGERSAKIISLPAGYEAVDGIMEISMADTNDVVFVLQATN